MRPKCTMNEVSNQLPVGCVWLRTAMNAAQHTIIDLLKTL